MMEELKQEYTNARYVSGGPEEGICAILVDVDGVEHGVPVDPNNRHYKEIMALVDAGELVIADA